MASLPRLYLFYGSDEFSSFEAQRAWRLLFEKKYSQSTRYVIEADEVKSVDLVIGLIDGYIQGGNLFSDPTLLVVKRFTTLDKNKRGTDKLLNFLKAKIKYLPQDLTLLFWEERNLTSENPLIEQFMNWQAQGLAKVQAYQLPEGGEALRRYIQNIVQKKWNLKISSQALDQIGRQYLALGKKYRLQQRLKVQDIIPEDDRSWWLQAVITNLALVNQSDEISLAAWEAQNTEIPNPFGAFDFVQVISNKNWAEATKIIQAWEMENQDSNSYFALLAALRWSIQNRRLNWDRQDLEYLEQLLAEIEIILKNFSLEANVLFVLMLGKLQQAFKFGQRESILERRKLWLASLGR
jgi:hypothetical protein